MVFYRSHSVSDSEATGLSAHAEFAALLTEGPFAFEVSTSLKSHSSPPFIPFMLIPPVLLLFFEFVFFKFSPNGVGDAFSLGFEEV